ncbi:FAD:protein FMN transferase [Methylibium sp.]|uniref:FAD:protein FMN transferase n=1 Tax=Methylibium sp. TaxID=2067992 RepID=UPI003D127B1D
MDTPPRWLRRARPLLGTLVEIGVAEGTPPGVIEAAFAAITLVQRRMSRFEPASDIALFNAARNGTVLPVHRQTAAVLALAQQLQHESKGLFDASQGRPHAWRIEGLRLRKSDPRVQLDLGGIAKGYAVDRAVDTLRGSGVAHGWVNAGGDLRAFGSASLPVAVRDEAHGGARPFGRLGDGAFATSHYGAGSRARLHTQDRSEALAHVSVAAPECVWADALTKVVALAHDPSHPLLAAHGGIAWLH